MGGNMKDVDTMLKELEERFTPFAFLCECDSEHCNNVRNEDRYAIGQHHTVQRVVEWLRDNLQGSTS
jgi:hypothetical protein